MNVGHVSVLMLGAAMQVFMRVSHIYTVVSMEFIVAVPVFVHHRHMNMKMGVFFVCQ
jgi:hypothetical protein